MADNATNAPNLRSDLDEVLRGSGISDRPETFDSDIHSWRCSHPDRYGRCSCFTELIDDLVPIVKKHEVAALRKAALNDSLSVNAQSTLLILADGLEADAATDNPT